MSKQYVSHHVDVQLTWGDGFCPLFRLRFQDNVPDERDRGAEQGHRQRCLGRPRRRQSRSRRSGLAGLPMLSALLGWMGRHCSPKPKIHCSTSFHLKLLFNSSGLDVRVRHGRDGGVHAPHRHPLPRAQPQDLRHAPRRDFVVGEARLQDSGWKHKFNIKPNVFYFLTHVIYSQVTCEYYFDNGACVPTRVHTVVVSVQHSEKVTLEALRSDIMEKVIKTTIPSR